MMTIQRKLAKTAGPAARPATPDPRTAILLAGGGDLCRRVAPLLVAQGNQVWGLRRHPPKNDRSGVRWITADLTRRPTLSGLPRPISRVVYAPAPDAPDLASYRAVFEQGLHNLIAALGHHDLSRFVFVSSSAVYGDHGGRWVDEDSALDPVQFNGRVLAQAEQWLQAEVPNAVRLRLAGLYGPQRTKLLARLQSRRATTPQYGAQWANRFHIDDAARAIAHLLELDQPLPCYIGSDSHPYKIDELYAALAALLRVDTPGKAPSNRAPTSKRLDNARLRASGFELQWPDALDGYRAIIRQARL